MRSVASGQHIQPRRFDTSICPPISIIDRSERQMPVFNESQHIFVRPVENRIDGFHMVSLRLATIPTTFRRFVVSLVALRALRLPYTHDALVHHLVFFQFLTAEARETVRKSLFCYELKEHFLWTEYFGTHTLHMSNRARRVNRSVAVDGTVADASFLSQLQNHVRVFATRIRHLYLPVIPILYTLQQPNGTVYLFL